MRWLVSALLVVSILGPSSAVAASFMTLGNVFCCGSNAFDISGDGSTVVGSGSNGGGIHTGFVWRPGVDVRFVGDLDNGIGIVQPLGVSSDGTVVVGYAEVTREDDSLGADAIVWTEDLGTRRIPNDDPAWSLSLAHSISADGRIIAGTAEPSTYFVWSTDSGFISVGEIPATNVVAFSADGSTVVGTTSFGSASAFLWDETDGLRDLVLPVGVELRDTTGISGDGSTVVGNIQVGDAIEGFSWTESSGIGFLGDKELGTMALGISDDGSVIVGEHEGRAVVWRDGGQLEYLQVLLTTLGVDLGDWTLAKASGVSSNGRAIIGRAINSTTGQFEPFYAVIPEPGAAILLGLGLIGLASARRRR